MLRSLLALLITATGVRANYADDAYAATYKLFNSALSGTCSLYRRPAPDPALYLVTTQHQLEGSKGDFCFVVLREPQPDGSYKRNDFKVITRVDGKPTWVKHPKFDLAVLRITTLPTGTFAALPTTAIANDERLKAAHPSVGSPLLLFTFPHGVESIRQGFPVARQAVFAQPPLLNAEAYPTFQADFPASAGDSGGPGVIAGPNGQPLIVGMCFQRMNHDEKVTTETTTTTVKHPLNMGTFIHGRYLLEAIELAAKE
jgi:hypothetical protein